MSKNTLKQIVQNVCKDLLSMDKEEFEDMVQKNGITFNEGKKKKKLVKSEK